ncbi:MAG: peptidylprolyl isomerase [Arcobacteraceae bacterium]|nr:peptidylprolyl isomerase [Arcobacteraceae bacterium]
MITWMQRHKRWLVITIWISTIAFVGAGFVGWGSYDYGKSSANAGTVGSKEITIKDIQNEYNALYSQYQNIFGEAFNQEMAKQFKLEDAAFNAIVQKFLLLNYADELGLYITDQEVAKYLVAIPAFIKDKKFDKTTYLSVLKQNRTTPTDFEQQVKMDLTIQKVQRILSTKVMDTELENLAKLYSTEDKVSISILNKVGLKIDSSTEAVKKYWEQNKQNYKSAESIKISMSKTTIGEDKKASKKEALKKYLKLKKDELKFDTTTTVSQNNDILNQENLQKVSKASAGILLKPLENNGEFIVIKVLEKQAPKALSFEAAYNLVRPDYLDNAKQEILNTNVAKLTKEFTGTDIGFIAQGSQVEIKGLSVAETTQLVNHIFNSTTTINSLMLEDKAVVYKITDSKLSNYSSSLQTDELKDTLLNLKNSEVISNLLKELRNQYEVTSNMKVN